MAVLDTDLGPADVANITVNGGGLLNINVPAGGAFDPTDLTLASGAGLGLMVDRDLSDDVWGGETAHIYISKPDYAGTLTLNAADTMIGSDETDAASIVNPLQGTAAQVTFTGGDNLLTLPAGVIDEADLGDGAPVSVAYDKDVRVAGAQTYTGDTMIEGGRVYAMDPGAFGSGAVATLGGTLDLQTDLANPVVFGGGGIYATCVDSE